MKRDEKSEELYTLTLIKFDQCRQQAIQRATNSVRATLSFLWRKVNLIYQPENFMMA